MARIAKHGLSKHAAKGFRLSIGRKPDGNYRTFWLGKHRLAAEYHAEQLRGRFDSMSQDGRDVWTDDDLRVVTFAVDGWRQAMAALRSPENLARLTAPLRAINVIAVDPEIETAVTVPTVPTPLVTRRKTPSRQRRGR